MGVVDETILSVSVSLGTPFCRGLAEFSQKSNNTKKTTCRNNHLIGEAKEAYGMSKIAK